MIDYIKGTLVKIAPTYIVVDVGGVGYQAHCANPYRFSQWIDTDVTIATYHYVREDSERLFGFQTEMERELFEQLLNVSGIGPKGALALLAAGEPTEVARAIEAEDEAFLVRFPGVGKKTARQMILDLKGKVSVFLEAGVPLPGEDAHTTAETSEALIDALEALRALGYSEKELKKVKKQLQGEGLSTETYVRRALQMMLK
ncbi:Holliday junction branch migration protein RuvA [Bacillus sp. FSL W7-1360]